MSRPPFLCTCTRLVPYGERCPCKRTGDRERKARHDRRRPSAFERGYDRAWRICRAEFLERHPHCQHEGCGRSATVVHHKVPHKGDQRLFWIRSNWQAVCQRCHDGPLQSQERRS